MDPRRKRGSSVLRDIGHRIKWARLLITKNQAKFAREMGMDRSTYAHIERGSGAISAIMIIDLCKKLKVTPNYILYGSLKGVDGETAARLALDHPELLTPIVRLNIDRSQDTDNSE